MPIRNDFWKENTRKSDPAGKVGVMRILARISGEAVSVKRARSRRIGESPREPRPPLTRPYPRK